MSQEKYVEHYLDILTKTMQDSIIKNISLQANLKVTEGIIKELQDGNNSLQKKVDELNGIVSTSQETENSKLQHLHTTINDLRRKLSDYEIIKKEYEEVKHQVQHIDTFRNELSKTRDELQNIDDVHKIEIEKVKSEYEHTIRELNDQIIYLKLTPAKRKKFDEAKAIQEVVEEVSLVEEEAVITDEVIKDGGSF